MPEIRYTGGSTYALRDGPTWTEGDVHEIDGATANRLAELDKFELVDDGSDDDADNATEFDVYEWLDQGYQTRADLVASGEMDESLGKILQVETSETVKDAVDDRRGEA